MQYTRPLFRAIAALLLPATALAHHSAADIDLQRTLNVHGTVREFRWANPHAWLFIEGNGTEGQGEYSFEGPPVFGLTRMGVKATDIKAGDEVDVSYHPRKQGKPGGNMATVTLSATGKVLTVGLGAPPGPAGAQPAPASQP